MPVPASGLVVASSDAQAQTEGESEKLTRFVAIMQYIRSQPTPSDVHAANLGTLDFLDGALTDIYIDGFIAPFTGESAEEVESHLESAPGKIAGQLAPEIIGVTV